MPTDQATTLEDAEVLLDGKKYLECQRCATNNRFGRRILNADCPDCYAWGVVVNPVYASAAQRAGLPVPLPMTKEKMNEFDAIMGRIQEYGIRVDQSFLDDPSKRLLDDSRRGR